MVAIFVAMCCLLLVTVMVTRVHEDLSTTQLGAKQTRESWFARGLVNQLFYNLNQEAAAADFNPDGMTLELTSGDLKATGVIKVDPVYPNVFHLRATCGRQTVSEVLVRSSAGGSATFAGSLSLDPLDLGFHDVDALFYQPSGSTDWTEMPDPSRRAYDANGNLVSGNFDIKRRYLADHKGSLFAVLQKWGPDADTPGFSFIRSRDGGDWANLSPLPRLDANYSLDDLRFENLDSYETGNVNDWTVDSSGDSLYVARNFAKDFGRGGDVNFAAIQKLDLGSPLGQWSIIKGPPDASYDSDGTLNLASGDDLTGSIGNITATSNPDGGETRLYVTSSNVIYGLDDPSGSPDGSETPNWVALPPVPEKYFTLSGSVAQGRAASPQLGAVAFGSDGKVFTIARGSSELGIVFLDPNDLDPSWELLPLEPPKAGGRFVNLGSEYGNTPLSVDADGNVVLSAITDDGVKGYRLEVDDDGVPTNWEELTPSEPPSPTTEQGSFAGGGSSLGGTSSSGGLFRRTVVY